MGRRKRVSPETVRDILLKRAEEAVALLLSLMQDESVKPELRMKAAESILDRACGKGSVSGEAKCEGAQTVRFEGVLEEWSR
jgi:hypothetical protein